MRNLLEYPITAVEVLQCLEEVQRKEMDGAGIGGLNPYILDRLMEIVNRDFKSEDYNPCTS